MTSNTLLGLLLIVVLIDAIPLDYQIRQYEIRQRRSVDRDALKQAETIFKTLFPDENRRNEEDETKKSSQNQPVDKPVDGPMNIEHVPMMLESRKIARYRFSLDADPYHVGR